MAKHGYQSKQSALNTPREAVLATSLQALHAHLKPSTLKRSFEAASRVAETPDVVLPYIPTF